ncbi:hypothetical protein TNCV_1712061 [Trichonephila clavipes]|nr:hypothetical protein TNCV_1712061 [Trichonephila clavipes]
MFGRQIAALSHPPGSVTELKRALQEAWNRLSPQLIHPLIATASLLERLVEGEERPEFPDHPSGCSSSELGWNQVKSYCHLYGAQSCG